MEEKRIVEEFFQTIEKNDFLKAHLYLDDNFKVTGVAPEPLGAKEFLGVHKALGIGMPDFRFNYKIEDIRNNIVNAKVKITGTHTKEMPAPIPMVDKIPATNKKVQMPEENVRVTLKDNKISEVYLEPTPGGGILGILKQIGVDVTKAEPSY